MQKQTIAVGVTLPLPVITSVTSQRDNAGWITTIQGEGFEMAVRPKTPTVAVGLRERAQEFRDQAEAALKRALRLEVAACYLERPALCTVAPGMAVDCGELYAD